MQYTTPLFILLAAFTFTRCTSPSDDNSANAETVAPQWKEHLAGAVQTIQQTTYGYPGYDDLFSRDEAAFEEQLEVRDSLVITYNASNNPIKMTRFDTETGAPVTETQYLYNDAGALVEESYLYIEEDVTTQSKVTAYYEDGLLPSSITHYRPNGDVFATSQQEYTDGKLSKEYTISGSGDTIVYAFDYNQEHFNTSITATANGVVDEDFSERIEYLERDEMGNWTKRRRFSLLSDEPIYEFRKLIYR